jgi:hypothetical protein
MTSRTPAVVLREACVFPSADNANRNSRSWPAIVRLIILEILVLLALAGAFVYYLNWSSEVAMSEFMAVSKAQIQSATVHPRCGDSA